VSSPDVPALAAARARVGLVALLIAVAAPAWWSTVRAMAGMSASPTADLGTLGWFVGVWIVTMAAMMLPAVSPTVALYARMTRQRGLARPAAFTSGYLVVSGAAGAGPTWCTCSAGTRSGLSLLGMPAGAGWPPGCSWLQRRTS
jgi:hypothetical protein